MTIILNILKALLTNKTVLLISSYIILIGVIVFGYNKYQNMKEEANRLSTNQEALMTDIEYFKTESGKNAAKVIEMEMSKGEFEKLCSEQVDIIKDLNLKVKRLEYVSTTGTETNIDINTKLNDTIIYVLKDTVLVKENAKHFEWNDDWNRIEGTIVDDNVNCKYTGRDTLTVVATKVPKKFLFFKWGCKHVEVNIVNENPSSSITYNRTIKLNNK